MMKLALFILSSSLLLGTYKTLRRSKLIKIRLIIFAYLWAKNSFKAWGDYMTKRSYENSANNKPNTWEKFACLSQFWFSLWHKASCSTREVLSKRCNIKCIIESTARKSHLYIPPLGIARPQSQFPHSCVCEQFIYYQDRSTYFPAAK